MTPVLYTLVQEKIDALDAQIDALKQQRLELRSTLTQIKPTGMPRRYRQRASKHRETVIALLKKGPMRVMDIVRKTGIKQPYVYHIAKRQGGYTVSKGICTLK